MRWTQIADRRDECPPPLPRRALLLKEERLEMHSTHHNQLLQVMPMFQKEKKQVSGCYHFTTEEGRKKNA